MCSFGRVKPYYGEFVKINLSRSREKNDQPFLWQKNSTTLHIFIIFLLIPADVVVNIVTIVGALSTNYKSAILTSLQLWFA